MRALTLLFAVILLLALAGYVLKERVRWLATALIITSAILASVSVLLIVFTQLTQGQ